MDSNQIERLGKHRTLPDEGEFLAGEDAYDPHAHELPTGTVPADDPRTRPAEGDVVDDPLEQRATAPEAPVTPDPYRGAHPSADGRVLKPDTDAVEQTILSDPEQ